MRNSGKKYITVFILVVSLCACMGVEETGSTDTIPSITESSVIEGATRTKNVTLTPDLVPTLIPTFSWDETSQFWTEMRETNGNCVEMPCWWGFNINQTSWSEIYEYFNDYAVSIIDYEEKFGNDAFHEIRFEDDRIFFLEGEDGKIDLLAFDYRGSLADILNHYGVPGSVRLSVNINMTDYPDTFFFLIYPDQGVTVLGAGYGQRAGSIDSRQVQECSEAIAEYGIRVFTWPTNSAEMDVLGGYENLVREFSRGAANRDISLEDAADITPEEFFERFSNPETNACMDIPFSVLNE